MPSGYGTRRTQKQGGGLPFDVDVTHLLPCDAEVIEDDVLGVPDDAAQEEPGQSREQKQHERVEILIQSPPRRPGCATQLFS